MPLSPAASFYLALKLINVHKPRRLQLLRNPQHAGIAHFQGERNTANKKKYKSYWKNRTNQEEYAFLIEIRDRPQFRLSHQSECHIYSVRTEEMELEGVIWDIRMMDGVGSGIVIDVQDPDFELLSRV